MTLALVSRDETLCREGLDRILAGIPVVAPLPAHSGDPFRTLRIGGKTLVLSLAWAPGGTPRAVRAALHEALTRVGTELPRGAGVQRIPCVLAPRLGPTGRRLCLEAGAGWCDLAGNVRISAGALHLDRERPEPRRLPRRELRRLFAPRAARVLRVLLYDVARSWSLTDLAREAGVSVGLVHRVKERLLDEELARVVDRRVRLHEPEALLRRWGSDDASAPAQSHEVYAPGTSASNERMLLEFCRAHRIPCALTNESGFARRVGPIRYLVSSAWVVAPVPELIAALGWEPPTRRANVRLLEPSDYGTLYGVQEIDGERVVSDLQLHLDLSAQGERGRAAAAMLLERRLRPAWSSATPDGEAPQRVYRQADITEDPDE